MTGPRKQKTGDRRGGFTLLELMIVMVIIAILIGLLLPAVAGAIKRTRVAGVKLEISQLDSAIALFKSAHGIEPPSSIVLFETGSDWNTAAAINSRPLIRQIWPQYDFASHDINGDGDTTDTITLTIGECLVFFLGGVNGNSPPGATANNNIPANIGACTGFSKNPANPFERGGSREAPLFDFQVARFTDLDGDGFPEYKDALPSQTAPYLYYSSYEGQGYSETAPEFGTGGLTRAYRQGPLLSSPFWKPNSHQIISPGYDRMYGFGGAYLASGSTRLPAPAPGPPTPQDRLTEADNITNFSDAELQP